MKRIIVIFLLLVEVFGLFAIELHFAKGICARTSVFPEIPEEMQLTTCKEVSDSMSGVVVPEGETIFPRYISEDAVDFIYENSESDEKELIIAGWDDFVEYEELSLFWENHMLEKELVDKSIIQRGIKMGVLLGVCWLITGSVFSILLIKWHKHKAMFIGHIIISLGIYVVAVFSAL